MKARKTVVIIQCRLGSSRLPGKALLPLGSENIISHVIDTMHNVPADDYYLATDYDSQEKLKTFAEKHGFKCFAGPENDVLKRFCMVIKESAADIIVRATGDNPFLFADAASSSLERFIELSEDNKDLAYFTYTGIPHGSGVEVISAEKLLQADSESDSSYEREHVAPSLYNHKDRYLCVFEKAPEKWHRPELRTTVDTILDYKRALKILKITRGSVFGAEIIKAAEPVQIQNSVLFVPCVKAGSGTGHLRRCISLAEKLNAEIYIPENAGLKETSQLIKNSALKDWQVISELPLLPENEKYSLIVCDSFISDSLFLKKLSELGPVCSLDDGTEDAYFIEYLLDIIPSSILKRKSNFKNPLFIDLPEKRKTEKFSGAVKKILVSVGGEDPAGYSKLIKAAFEGSSYDVTVVTPENGVKNLKERLYEYDVVITHYGFTAFEASAAGCRTVLLATTPLHKKLSDDAGFVCLSKRQLSSVKAASKALKKILSGFEKPENCADLNPKPELNKSEGESESLSSFVEKISCGQENACPVCGKRMTAVRADVFSRCVHKTYRKCSCSELVYLSWNCIKKSVYDKSYFFDDYKKQYGKTYLEDFENIKKQGIRRAENIKKMLKNVLMPALLDIGCAYGPFLKAAEESGMKPFGTDISESAVSYVSETLGFPAVVSDFPNIDCSSNGNSAGKPCGKAFFDGRRFNCVSMWYVIEHFENLSAVLAKVSELLSKDGIFAFSTPYGKGVSGLFFKDSFYEQSPTDHYFVMDKRSATKILKSYGFGSVRFKSTGHHPERFPLCRNIRKNGILYKILLFFSRIFFLGDTFEVYCRKR